MKRWISLGVLSALLITLTACAPAIETDESEWVEQITLGSSSSTNTSATSNTAAPSTSASITESTADSTQSTESTASSSTTSTTNRTTPTTTTAQTTTGTTASVENADLSVGYVNASSLNVRAAANPTAEIVGGLKRGEQVTITGRSGDWYMITFGDITAYVSAQYISSTPIAE